LVACAKVFTDRELGRLREGLHTALLAALFRDAIQCDFGLLDLALGIDRFGRVDRLLDHLAPDADQRAQQRQIIDLRRKVACADQGGARTGQLREIGRSAQFPELGIALEHRPQRDRVGDHVAIDHLQYGFVDAAMRRLEEMVGPELELDVLGQPVIDHQRTEQSRLRLHIVGKHGSAAFRRLRRYKSDRFGHAGSNEPKRPRPL